VAHVARRRLLDGASQARAIVLDLSQASRDAIEIVAALGVPIWTDLHDYDGTAAFTHRSSTPRRTSS